MTAAQCRRKIGPRFWGRRSASLLPAACRSQFANLRSRSACPGGRFTGRKLASWVFGHCRQTSVRRTPCKSLNSNRVARSAAVETASDVRPHPPEPTLRFPIYDYDFRRSPEAAGPSRSSPPTATTVGVSFYGLRYHDPAKGRFLSRDPISERGGANIYAFTRNSPLNYFDAFGAQIAEPAPAEPPLGEVIPFEPDPVFNIGGGLHAPIFDLPAPKPDSWFYPFRNPADIKPGGPGPINPELRAPNTRRFPSPEPIPNFLPPPVPSVFFTPFDKDERTKCAKCLAIIGETYDPRVLAAKTMYPTAETFAAPDGASNFGTISGFNLGWIRGVMDRGCMIVDTGYDSARGPKTRGWYYPLELFATEGYANKIFQQFPGSSYYGRKVFQ